MIRRSINTNSWNHAGAWEPRKICRWNQDVQLFCSPLLKETDVELKTQTRVKRTKLYACTKILARSAGRALKNCTLFVQVCFVRRKALVKVAKISEVSIVVMGWTVNQWRFGDASNHLVSNRRDNRRLVWIFWQWATNFFPCTWRMWRSVHQNGSISVSFMNFLARASCKLFNWSARAHKQLEALMWTSVFDLLAYLVDLMLGAEKERDRELPIK